ncbi:MAG: hypothetical protein LBR18_05295 [Tannerella sp.]|nr:hypothetical protein [Tannerella sp.]
MSLRVTRHCEERNNLSLRTTRHCEERSNPEFLMLNSGLLHCVRFFFFACGKNDEGGKTFAMTGDGMLLLF